MPIGVRSGLLGGQGIGSPLPIRALGNFSFKAPRTGRLNGEVLVLHENDPVPSFSLYVFSSWENLKLKQVQVNVSSNGALHKKERAYNTITEQPTPNIHFRRTMNVLVNSNGLF
jgi:hypothetical protein